MKKISVYLFLAILVLLLGTGNISAQQPHKQGIGNQRGGGVGHQGDMNRDREMISNRFQANGEGRTRKNESPYGNIGYS